MSAKDKTSPFILGSRVASEQNRTLRRRRLLFELPPSQGKGSFDGELPPLIHNSAVGRAESNNLAIVILEGLRRGPDVFMPRFANVLSDRQIATVSIYLFQRFGNPQGSMSEQRVKACKPAAKPRI